MMTLDARTELLFTLADDEFILGQRDLEWTGIAPTVEEDVAFASIAQDEIGHALALYELAENTSNAKANAFAFDRAPSGFRHARLLEQPRGDFAFSIARRFVYELADRLRIDVLTRSAWTSLRDLCMKIRVEEPLHFDHAWLWMRRLSANEPGRGRMDAALRAVLPTSGSLLAPVFGEDILVASGDAPCPWHELYALWRDSLERHLRILGFEHHLEFVAKEPVSDRCTPASALFLTMHERLTRVRRGIPGSTW